MFDKTNKQTSTQTKFLVFFFFFFYRRVTHKRYELWNNRAEMSAPFSDDNSNAERL